MLSVFLRIVVADTKIICCYNFAAPLSASGDYTLRILDKEISYPYGTSADKVCKVQLI